MDTCERSADWVHWCCTACWSRGYYDDRLKSLCIGRIPCPDRLGKLCLWRTLCPQNALRIAINAASNRPNCDGCSTPRSYRQYRFCRTTAANIARTTCVGNSLRTDTCSGWHITCLPLLLLALRTSRCHSNTHRHLSATLYGTGLWRTSLA